MAAQIAPDDVLSNYVSAAQAAIQLLTSAFLPKDYSAGAAAAAAPWSTG
jgi:hypothetical protein